MADEGRLQGKAALVTGGAQGIGRESALLFAVEGARVAVVDLNLDGAATVAGEITAAGGEAIAIGADVSVDADVAAMVAGTEEAFGALHVLFNNAGIMLAADGDAQSTEEAVWDLTMDVNLKGVWFGCRHGIRRCVDPVAGRSSTQPASWPWWEPPHHSWRTQRPRAGCWP